MLKKRIIPVLLINNNSIVKTIKYKNPRIVGDIISAVKVFNQRMADELIILNIGKQYGSEFNKKLIENISKFCFMPLSFGGGIRNLQDAYDYFELGADKIVINNIFYYNKKLLKKIIKIFGSQAVIFSLDYVYDKSVKKFFCVSGGKIIKKNPLNISLEAERIGVGEIIFSDVDNDGKMKGYNINYLNTLINNVTIPSIAVGGCSSKQDFLKLSQTNVSGMAASSIFFWIGESIISIKKFLNYNDVPVRII